MGGMRDLEILFNDTIRCFNDRPLSKKNFFSQRLRVCFHRAFDTGDKL
jgi:hypothetical protein